MKWFILKWALRLSVFGLKDGRIVAFYDSREQLYSARYLATFEEGMKALEELR